MSDNKNYLEYPTIARLNNKEKDNYHYGHVTIADLMKEIEMLKNRVAILENNQIKEKKEVPEQKLEEYGQIVGIIENLKTTKEETFNQSNQKVKVGDVVTLGKYKEKPVEWIVLDEKEDGAKLLLSKYILDNKEYNEEFTGVTWETCTLRSYLNDDFYKEAFTTEEQSKIQTAILINEDNERYGTEGGNDTEDKVFLLSIDEVNRYFKSHEERECKATDYAKEQGIYVDEDTGNVRYWLRSPGYYSDSAARVCLDGSVNEFGYRVGITYGIRPAMWIQI